MWLIQPCVSLEGIFHWHPDEDLLAQKRFAMYQPLLSRIISKAGSYENSDFTSYESGLHLMLKVIRRIFWPNAAQPWGRVLEFHREAHGIELKRRILYYLAGALWNQFRKEMQSATPRTHRRQAWFGPVSSDVEVCVSRAPPSLRYLHEIIKTINRACKPPLLEEKLLWQAHTMMSHEARVTHTLSLGSHKASVCGSANQMSFEKNASAGYYPKHASHGWCRHLPCSLHVKESPEDYDIFTYPCRNNQGPNGLNRTLACLYMQQAGNPDVDSKNSNTNSMISSSDNWAADATNYAEASSKYQYDHFGKLAM